MDDTWQQLRTMNDNYEFLVYNLTLLLCREVLNALFRRRRQSSLKYGQGLQGEAPKFLYHLAIIVITSGLFEKII